MKKQEEITRFFFVDESGDSTFYDARGNLIIGKNSKNGGCASYLMLGFVQTDDPKLVREKLSNLHKNLCEDPYFSKSKAFLNTTAKLFHATDDPPEIRREVFKLIKDLPIRGEFIFARKRESTFRNS